MATGRKSRQERLPKGDQDWETAAATAADCRIFRPDVDEEQVADEPRSCYNCRYRRWTAEAIDCLAEPA